jgi:hypothetical protein
MKPQVTKEYDAAGGPFNGVTPVVLRIRGYTVSYSFFAGSPIRYLCCTSRRHRRFYQRVQIWMCIDDFGGESGQVETSREPHGTYQAVC